MANNNISAPKPDEQAMTGEEYNALRQDLLNNHRHSGPNDGGPLSHLSLSDIGKYTHPQIDAHLDAVDGVHGLPAGVKPVGGSQNTYNYAYRNYPNEEPHTEVNMVSGPPIQLRAGVVDWPNYHFDWGLNQTYPALIPFDPPLPANSAPVVTITLCKNGDPQAPLAIPILYDLSSTGFTVRFIVMGDVPERSLKFTWIAVVIQPPTTYTETIE